MQCSCSVSQLWLCVDLARAVGIGGRCMWGVCLCKEQKKKAWCKSVCATILPSPPNRSVLEVCCGRTVGGRVHVTVAVC